MITLQIYEILLAVYFVGFLAYSTHCMYILSLLAYVENWFRMPLKREIVNVSNQGRSHYRRNLIMSPVWIYPLLRDIIFVLKRIYLDSVKK
jgi:hypothetical protein|tara:strand:+ start:542 stop:814 length:273 start_codon:yes stop_codon:yes gene_type:complete